MKAQARLKFSVTIPANYSDNSAKIKARVRLQAVMTKFASRQRTMTWI
jgi:hypothetical protein